MNYFKTEKILITIGAIIFMLMGLGIWVIGNYIPLKFDINGNNFTVNYWDIARVSMSGYWLWGIFGAIPCVIGLIGFVCRRFLSSNPKKGWGVILIILGVISIFSLVGVLYLVAGIMIMKNKYWLQKTAVNEGLKVD
ncbi:hypothetical protein HCB22_08850 [Listeria welshimeri]|nr:hypothetical protein [Listeria welshimeri]MBC2672935.1 hypothetical protein [Listeria welshimeri]